MLINRQKRQLIILDIVLIAGLLTHSIIFLFINKTMFPYSANGELIGEILRQRLPWRRFAEHFSFFCSFLYCLGICIIFLNSMKKHHTIPFKDAIACFATQIFLMLVCTVPFALFDISFFADYLFQIRGALGILVLLFLAFVAVSFFFRVKK